MAKKPAAERFEDMEAKNLQAAEIILAGRYDGLMLEWATRVKEKSIVSLVNDPVKAST